MTPRKLPLLRPLRSASLAGLLTLTLTPLLLLACADDQFGHPDGQMTTPKGDKVERYSDLGGQYYYVNGHKVYVRESQDLPPNFNEMK